MLRHQNMIRVCKPAHWTTSHIALAQLLAHMTNDDDECWPSFQYIADQIHLSRRRAMELVSDLERDGWIKRTRKRNSSNVYLWTMSGLSLVGGATHRTRGVRPIAPQEVRPVAPRRVNKCSEEETTARGGAGACG